MTKVLFSPLCSSQIYNHFEQKKFQNSSCSADKADLEIFSKTKRKFVLDEDEAKPSLLSRTCEGIQSLIEKVKDAVSSLFSCFLPKSDSLIDFYEGKTRNSEGVRIIEIVTWSDEKIESVHNHIQWLFPLKQASAYNQNAPTLDRHSIKRFQKSPLLQRNLLTCLQRMLSFYGLIRKEKTGKISKASHFSSRKAVWLTKGNHNFKRITRIISSLRLLGRKEDAKALFKCMKHIYRHEGEKVIKKSEFAFWKNAAKG
ncbi:MAG: opioid growth factor receptor-related protein [Anaerolineae bacterium]